MGRPFGYDGSLDTGLVIHMPKSTMRISADSIAFIRDEIQRRSPVLMGANRDPLVRNSVGETLALQAGKSPQLMSYVLPLLVEEGFCRVSSRRPYLITLCRR